MSYGNLPHPITKPRLRPVIRVFVSSTFSDMKHERNALAADVFPKLEQLCQRHGFQFQAIDLRWGVSEEPLRAKSPFRFSGPSSSARRQ